MRSNPDSHMLGKYSTTELHPQVIKFMRNMFLSQLNTSLPLTWTITWQSRCPPPPPHTPGYSSSSLLRLGISVLRNLVPLYVTRLHIHPILRYTKAGSWFYLMPIILKHTSANLVIDVGSGDTGNRLSPDGESKCRYKDNFEQSRRTLSFDLFLEVILLSPEMRHIKGCWK